MRRKRFVCGLAFVILTILALLSDYFITRSALREVLGREPEPTTIVKFMMRR